MNIAHYVPALYPFKGYGGKERKAYWMAKAHAELGHKVYFLCDEGSELPFAETIAVPRDVAGEIGPYLPEDVDIVQYYATPGGIPQFPHLIHIGGNGRAGEIFFPNTVFGSRNHAERHGWTEYVMNGLDLSEYPFEPKKQDYVAFLARAKWKVKNLKGAIAITKDAGRKLKVGGGRAPFWHRHVKSLGTVDGVEKFDLLKNAHCFLFPIIWEEPFGNAVAEALACGTPVVTTPRGAMPELITPECGFLCKSHEELVEAVNSAGKVDPEACRGRVKERFTHIRMGEDALRYYKQILETGKIREGQPYVDEGVSPTDLTYYANYKAAF